MAKSTNGQRRSCRIKIRGQWWRIEIARPHHNRSAGTCDKITRTIRISPRTPIKFETLVHEILHACLWDLSEQAVLETEEAICKGLRLLERSYFSARAKSP